MSMIKRILQVVETKERKMLTCSKCKGSGFLEGFVHVQYGKCFKCLGSGQVPNKWKGIELEVQNFQKAMLETKEYLDQYEAAQMASAAKAGEGSNWYNFCVEQVRKARENYRKSAIDDLTKIAKKAGVV